jgi:hypothetical protein
MLGHGKIMCWTYLGLYFNQLSLYTSNQIPYNERYNGTFERGFVDRKATSSFNVVFLRSDKQNYWKGTALNFKA